MSLLTGAIVLLVVIFLLAYITVKKPGFGEMIIALAIILILIATFFYFQKDNRIEKKKQLIPLSQIELSDMSCELSYGNYYKLNAQLKNQSEKYRLQAIVLNISFFNCPASQIAQSRDFSQCRLIAEKKHQIDTRLAAQHSSLIESYFLLDNEKLQSNKTSAVIVRKIDLLSGIAR